MSRSLTVTQIITQGDYLDNDFDPNTLTVSQLLGVFTHHQIRYPSPYTKAKLVQLFLDEIRPKATKLRKERLKRENSLASDDGITDGLTGRPLNADAKGPRRSSRRLSRAPEDDELSQRPEPSKRRRSSAQPDLGRVSSTKARTNVPTLKEESEPEEEEPPVRKAARRKEDNPQTRRISLANDSGWEDNNIFQSGAESSSPTRPSPVRRTTRKSVTRRKSRHSMSAPPHLSPPSSPVKAPPFPRSSRQSPPQSKFEPQLPLGISRQPSVWSPPGKRTVFAPQNHQSSLSLAPERLPQSRTPDVASGAANHDANSVALPEGETAQSELSEQVTSTSRGIPSAVVNHYEPGVRSRSYLLALLYALCFLAFSSIVIKYKRESTSIGFCDAGSNSSRILQELQAHISATEPCVRTNRTLMDMPSELFDTITAKDGTSCSLLSLVPLPHPSACAPCPEYASCSQHTVTCNSGYLLRPHPILSLLSPFGAAPSAPVDLVWTFISEVADGLPGLGPVVFPPHCIEDPKRKRNIGALGKAIEALLSQERGRRVCAGEGGELTTSDSEWSDARKWGLEVDVLRETMKKKTVPQLLEQFDDTFDEAIQQLAEWGSVVFGEDISGRRYLAHKRANLTLNCRLTVKFREAWSRWRATVYGLLASACVVYAVRRVRTQRQIENKRVAELVLIALDTLRNQELAHHVDPVTAPHPYLSSLQLRDLILQEQHSISVRKRLWDQVERVVEGNANVRVNLEEVQGGDEHRVWRWVGTTGRGPEYRKRVQTETEKGEGHVA